MCSLELKDETFEGVCAVDWGSPPIYEDYHEEYNQGDKIWLHEDRRSFFFYFFFLNKNFIRKGKGKTKDID